MMHMVFLAAYMVVLLVAVGLCLVDVVVAPSTHIGVEIIVYHYILYILYNKNIDCPLVWKNRFRMKLIG